MPDIQVIDREDPARNPINAFQEQLRQQQETVSNIMYKKAQVEYQRDLAKLAARKADTEEAQYKADIDAKEWEQASTILQSAEKASKQKGGMYDTAMWDKLTAQWVLEAPAGVGKKLAILAKAGPQGAANPKDAYQQASAEALQTAMGGGQQGARAGAVGGAQPAQGGGMMPKGVSFEPSGATIDMFSPEAKSAEAWAGEQGKPYSSTEATLLKQSELLDTKARDLLDLIGKKGEPTEGTASTLTARPSRIMAFGEGMNPFQGGDFFAPAKKLVTGGMAKKMGVALASFKNIAFSFGGRTLSPTERATVMGLLTPENKTETKWKSDIMDLVTYLKGINNLMTQPRSQTTGQSNLKAKYGLE